MRPELFSFFYFRLSILTAICSVIGVLQSNAQVSDKISSVVTDNVVEGHPLGVHVELTKTVAFERVVIAYRQFGQSEYKEREMSVASGMATATIPGSEVVLPFLEYYIILYAQGNPTPETYPVENPKEQPLKATFAKLSEKENEVIILSPEKNERVSSEDFFVSISLLRASSTVDAKKTKLFINDTDVSEYAVFSDDLILLNASNLPSRVKDGSQGLRIELYDKEGKLYHTTNQQIEVSSGGESATPNPVTYNASIQLESRNETIANDQQSYNRGTMNVSSEYGNLVVRGKLYVTSEEKQIRQPQNRFFIGAELPWIKVGYGDNYPKFPRLIMDGKRLRGLNGNVALGFFNLDVALGEITRNIEGDTIKTFAETDTASFNNTQFVIGPYDTSTTPRRWAWFNYGTFKRDLFVVRPSFGSGENFQLGFSYLKAKDDIGSVRYGIKPQENLVLGSDLMFALFDHALEVTGQTAFSITNKDITTGSFPDSIIDRLNTGPDSIEARDNAKKFRDIVSQYITVNEHIIPLSLKNFTTLSYEGAAAINAFNNYFKFAYVRRGNNYESFGQNFIRTDVKGFTITDRLRLMQSQLFVTGGFERLQDNLGETKPASTTFTTYSGSVSYYPRTDFPNLTVGFVGASNENGLHRDSLISISDLSSRVFVQAGYDFVMNIRHSANLSVSLASRDDQTIRNSDTKNTSVSLNVSSFFRIPLQTTVGITANINKSSQFISGTSTSRDLNYTTLVFSGQYRMLEQKLRLAGTISPTFGDIERIAYDAIAQYFFMTNLSALTQLSLYNTKNLSNDVIWTIMLRYDI